jgi:hypothetical protein
MSCIMTEFKSARCSAQRAMYIAIEAMVSRGYPWDKGAKEKPSRLIYGSRAQSATRISKSGDQQSNDNPSHDRSNLLDANLLCQDCNAHRQCTRFSADISIASKWECT